MIAINRRTVRDVCMLCGKDDVDKTINTSNDFNTSLYKCPICGWYEVSHVNGVLEKIDRNKLTSFLFFNS